VEGRFWLLWERFLELGGWAIIGSLEAATWAWIPTLFRWGPIFLAFDYLYFLWFLLNRLGPLWFEIYGLVFGDCGCGVAEWVCPFGSLWLLIEE
jgi:hypothetical protein